MQPLNFPRAYAFDIRRNGERTEILDPLRRRYVLLTPEEWVRQNLVQYLVEDLGCPRGLTALEQSLDYHGKPFRADVVVHDRQGRAVLLAECKEPGVRLGPQTFEQVARYNRVVGARYLLITNGLEHYACAVDSGGEYRFLERLPPYAQM